MNFEGRWPFKQEKVTWSTMHRLNLAKGKLLGSGDEYLKTVKRQAEREKKALPTVDNRYDYMLSIVSAITGVCKDDIIEENYHQKQNKFVENFLNDTFARNVIFRLSEEHVLGEDNTGEVVKYATVKIHTDDTLSGICVLFAKDSSVTDLLQNSIHTSVAFTSMDVTSDNIFGAIYHLLKEIYFPRLKCMLTMEEANDDIPQNKIYRNLMYNLEALAESFKVAHLGLTRGLVLRSNLRDITSTRDVSVIEEKNIARLKTHSSEDLVTVWLEQIEEVLTESTRLRKEPENSGPRSELEFWKCRRDTFGFIVYQLDCQDKKIILEKTMKASEHLKEVWLNLRQRIGRSWNEAKECAAFLEILDTYCQVLYNENPTSIANGIPRLMKTLFRVHLVSKYYDSSERMTVILTKITNQIILSCKNYISCNGQKSIWDQDGPAVTKKLSECMFLNQEYQQSFWNAKKEMAEICKDKEFCFCEVFVFGKFDAFCQRLKKILKLFDCITDYHQLLNGKLNGILSPDEKGFQETCESFTQQLENLKEKKYDILDFRNLKFDEDFDHFRKFLVEVENYVMHIVDSHFKSLNSTLLALSFLRSLEKYSIFASKLEKMYFSTLKMFKAEVEDIRTLFKREKIDPPIPMYFSPVAGKINWFRQLARRLQDPVDAFKRQSQVLKTKFGKQVLKKQKDLCLKLLHCEQKVYQNWIKKVPETAHCLVEKLLFRDPETEEIKLNYNEELFLLIREADLLSKMEFHLPPVAKMALYQQTKYKQQKMRLQKLLRRHKNLKLALTPELQILTQIRLKHLDQVVYPALTYMNWSSYNVKSFLEHYSKKLDETEVLFQRINTILNQRVEGKLANIKEEKEFFIEPLEEITVKNFLENTKRGVKKIGDDLENHNNAISDAVCEVIFILIAEADLESAQNNETTRLKVSEAVAQLEEIYSKQFFEKVVKIICYCLEILSLIATTRIQKKSSSKIDILMYPSFRIEAQLCNSDVCINPSVEVLQQIFDQAADSIVRLSSNISKWKMNETSIMEPRLIFLFDDRRNLVAKAKTLPKHSIYSEIKDNRAIEHLVTQIRSCMTNVKDMLDERLGKFTKYCKLWTSDREQVLEDMLAENPSWIDFEDQIKHYRNLREAIKDEPDDIKVFCIMLNFGSLKTNLISLCNQWCTCFGEACREIYYSKLKGCFETVKDFAQRLNCGFSEIEDIKLVFATLEDLRASEVEIEGNILPIEDCYATLMKYDLVTNKKDIEKVDNLRFLWQKTQKAAIETQNKLLNVQMEIKNKLRLNIENFESKFVQFQKEYYENGPLATSLSPTDSGNKLLECQNQFDALCQVHDNYADGAFLFGYKQKEFPELQVIKKEMGLMHKLYKLYNDVMDRIHGYKDILWSTVDFEKIASDLIDFQNRCRKLPKSLKEWPAFIALKKTIDDFNELCPLLELMTNKAMKSRHWKRLAELTRGTFNVDNPNFCLKNILEAPLLSYKEEIEDICISALKEKDIESKLRQVTSEWNNQTLMFSVFKNRGELLLRGDSTAEVIAQLEDSSMVLGSLQNNRYNTPFKNQIQKWVHDLSNTNEILERWLFTQNMWAYLEAVFMGGDIAKQLPKEAKRFNSVDKSWTKVMLRAREKTNVVECCVGDDTLKQLLPHLQEQLEVCQKSLSGYLEKKRLMFPRFFFVSDPTLLEILGQASDSHAIQAHLLSIFDNTKSLIFDESDYNKILAVISSEGEIITLNKPVKSEGNAESWLMQLLKSSQKSLHSIIREAAFLTQDPKFSLMEFLREYPSQVSLLGLQMIWTKESESALTFSLQEKKLMSQTNDLFLELLNTLIDETTKELNSVQRTKFETLITIHVHQRDIFNDLCRSGIRSVTDFEWKRQFRFYFDSDVDETQIKITDVDFVYQNEFLGCAERLVITPLTDRCYVTLAQALAMNMGGSPTGPAGTGKTETTKDMGKTLGKYVVVFNCSDQMDYRGLGRIFKGLAQSGSWGCFDEFNRIDLPVLSVAAQQIAIVLNCKKEKKETFVFSDGDTVRMNQEFGIFLTMNPGYAGRQELPENLKIQFRTVAMMVPDRQIIIRVKLASCGFLENITLARKFYTLYKLCEEQLSKQVHYDFGLRNILSVLRTLGLIRRINVSDSESTIIKKVLRDMNLSKLLDEDEPLFLSLIEDLFPGIKDQLNKDFKLEEIVQNQLCEHNLISHPTWLTKVMQFHDIQLVRHGIMVLGAAGSGKTTCIRVVMDVLTELGKPHKELRMNPKAIMSHQMFGKLDAATNDWTDGIFSALWRKTLKMKSNEHVWLVLDGPVDAIWIENLNSVLDDNKTLTLANGDRIAMAPNCKVIFEVHNIENASPATVSRNGMVFMSSYGLPWKPILQAGLKNQSETVSCRLLKLFEESYESVLYWVVRNTKLKTKILNIMIISQIIRLLSGLIPKDDDTILGSLGKLYVFGLMWSFGAYLDIPDRQKLEEFLKSFHLDLPLSKQCNESIFNYKVNEKGNWQHWKYLVPEYKCPSLSTVEYNSILVPNIDNVRMDYLIDLIAKQEQPVLLIGDAGTGKSVMINSYLAKHDKEFYVKKSISFSSATTPLNFQKTIESYIEKRAGNIYGPATGKKMIVFIDDLNMPQINDWGDQVTNEIVRQTLESSGFYNLERPGDFTKLTDVQYLAAMCTPGGGRNEIPDRLKRHFTIFYCTQPSDDSIDKIFGKICKGTFSEGFGFSSDVISIAEKLVAITRELWKLTKKTKLPTPAKFHYVFNLRDLSRIWQGMASAQSSVVSNIELLLSLWKHECCRVICDRFTEQSECDWFELSLKILVSTHLEKSYVPFVEKHCYFVDFLRDAPEGINEDEEVETETPKVYEPVMSLTFLQDRLFLLLTMYNEVTRATGLDLVFFQDAVSHLVKISRILRTSGGHALLIGVGGSGKQSLTKLASYIEGYTTFQINLTRNYSTSNFLEDIKVLYKIVGIQDKGTTFLFTDQSLKEEAFLQYINNILTCGTVPNLFNKEEKNDIVAELAPIMKRDSPKTPPTPENVLDYFNSRIRKNLHLVLCFSPVGHNLHNRSLKFPGLISGCTIDWFRPWPPDALVSVSHHFLKNFQLQCESKVKQEVIGAAGAIHEIVAKECKDYFRRYRRPAYVTPKSFLSFIAGYKSVYSTRIKSIGDHCTRMEDSISKLEEASQSVHQMKLDLAKMEQELQVANTTAERVLAEVTNRANEAETVHDSVEKAKIKAQNIVEDIQTEKAIAEQKLEAAKPALEEAKAALNTIQSAHIATVRKLGRPPTLIMYIMDCVLILFQKRLPTIQRDHAKKFLKPSWEESLKFMSSTGFLLALQNFPKDTINDEVVELLEPYFRLKDYTMQTARRVCGDVAGLLSWTKAMASFFAINKEVLPLKTNLAIQESKLEVAMSELEKVEKELNNKETELLEVKSLYTQATKDKETLIEESMMCERKMSRATTLVEELSEEYKRWNTETKQLKEKTKRLVGDILIATGFLSYAGPFNQEYRLILEKAWREEVHKRRIPASENINVVDLLVNQATISDWTLNGLPFDELSTQNGILVTHALRYPLLVDPQGQGKAWIKNMEASNEIQITSLNHKYFRQHIEDSLSLGRSLIIEDVNEELDPILDNILEKKFIKSGSTRKVTLGEKECDVMPGFKIFITTKLANPSFTPEISAKTSIIDFTVTTKGLEDQLLGRVILSEKANLEQERYEVTSEISKCRRKIQELECNLLSHLNSAQEPLVDNEDLIMVLQQTKATAQKVANKLHTAAETQAKIQIAREEFRPAATRGSILYFLMVDMSLVNIMYQTSLKQVLEIFDTSLQKSARGSATSTRISNIIEYLTYEVYEHEIRGCYEQHKSLFTLLLALKLDQESGKISSKEILTFVQGGASIDLNVVPRKALSWVSDMVWLNLNQLSNVQPFKDIISEMSENETAWKKWFDSEIPEVSTLPCGYSTKLSEFQLLLLVRCLSPDRVLSQSRKYIAASLAPKYSEDIMLNLEKLIHESTWKTPLICLLSPGGDPSDRIKEMAKKNGFKYDFVSMGQGQEIHARRILKKFLKVGGWVMLQNCHLSLEFCDEILNIIEETENAKESFRLWITTEVHNQFPINLLQASLRFTNEPPRGIKVSLKRTFSNFPPDILEHSNAYEWRPLLYCIAFFNIILQERKKFGPLGWNVPYEFNQTDFTASVRFLQRHLDDVESKKGICWRTLRFMLSEVHYGGRVTDDYDKRLLRTYCDVWFTEDTLKRDFRFSSEYIVPNFSTLDQYSKYFETLPSDDRLEVFGLHPNVNISYQMNSTQAILEAITQISPQESAFVGDQTPECFVYKSASEILEKMQDNYDPTQVHRALQQFDRMEPMIIFLKQEIHRMVKVLGIVRSTLTDLKLAIDGTTIMSDALSEVFEDLNHSRTPNIFTKLSWESSTLGFWLTELEERNKQLKAWCFQGRPKSFWMTGFFNPIGFLTAMRQELTRNHSGWALDSVSQRNDITSFNSAESVKVPPKEGVYVHGLFLEGAVWDQSTGVLTESLPKVLYSPLPVAHVYAINSTSGKNPDVYECPIYKNPRRTDLTYVTSFDLKTDCDPNHWTLRSVALLAGIK